MERLAGLLAIAGSALLLASLFTGWYEFRYDGVSGQPGTPGGATFGGSSTFLPGSSFRSASFCSGDPVPCALSGNPNRSQDHPYAGSGRGFDSYANTGRLYVALQYALVAGTLLGFAAGAFALGVPEAWRRWKRPARAMLAVALLLALAAPLGVLVENPVLTHADYTTDFQGAPTNFTGPGGSFWGSCSTQSCGSGGGITDHWGPSLGWYEGWAAAVILAASTLLWVRKGRPASDSPRSEPETPAVSESIRTVGRSDAPRP